MSKPENIRFCKSLHNNKSAICKMSHLRRYISSGSAKVWCEAQPRSSTTGNKTVYVYIQERGLVMGEDKSTDDQSSYHQQGWVEVQRQ